MKDFWKSLGLVPQNTKALPRGSMALEEADQVQILSLLQAGM
jgi:hypothetical protein